MKWDFWGLFSYNPQKYIREKFLLSNPQKFPSLKLIHYTVRHKAPLGTTTKCVDYAGVHGLKQIWNLEFE